MSQILEIDVAAFAAEVMSIPSAERGQWITGIAHAFRAGEITAIHCATKDQGPQQTGGQA